MKCYDAEMDFERVSIIPNYSAFSSGANHKSVRELNKTEVS